MIHEISRELVNSFKQSLKTQSVRAKPNTRMVTTEDFQRCDESLKRVVVLGCTGAGKSTLLNVISGNEILQTDDGSWVWNNDDDVVFTSAHGCQAVTKTTALAHVDFLGDSDRPLIVVDTPGHNDTEGNEIGDVGSRAVLREQSADLHAKLKALRNVHLVLILHDQIGSNRLNPATYTILKMLDEKFSAAAADGNIWNHVAVAYSRCNHHDSTWKGDLSSKIGDLCREIRRQIPNCTVDVPVLTLGGGYPLDDPDARAADRRDFEKLWKLIQKAEPISTAELRPFDGADWAQFEEVVQRRDEAVARTAAAMDAFPVAFQIITCVILLMWRDAMPTSMSLLMFNLPFTIIDEFILVAILICVIGPQKVYYTSELLATKYCLPYVAKLQSSVEARWLEGRARDVNH